MARFRRFSSPHLRCVTRVAMARPHLEFLEDRVQPGETLFLGFTTLALVGGLPIEVEMPAAAENVVQRTVAGAELRVLLPNREDAGVPEWPSTANANPTVSTGSAAFEEEMGHADWPLRLNDTLAQSAAAVRHRFPPLGDAAPLATVFGGVATGSRPGLGNFLPPVPSTERGTDHLLLAFAGQGALTSPLFFDAATGTLVMRGDAGDNTVRQTLAAEGFVEVRMDGRDYSSDPTAATYHPALAGVTATSLTGLRFVGNGGRDTLTLGEQLLPHGLTVVAPDAEVIANDVTASGLLRMAALRLTLTGALRAEAIALAATGLLNIEQRAALHTAPGGRIEAAADVFVNVGQLRADGTGGGSILVQARNVLNAGTLAADGDTGAGGTVQVAFTGAYIETAAGILSARSASGAGGHILVTGGTTGRLYTSGTQQATGRTGGAVDLLGREVLLVGDTVDASGVTAGGSVRIGGDFQGRNSAVVNAQSVTVTSAATIRANAQQSGDGGRVIVWADGETTFAGSVSARGGAAGGDGGFIEVSGKGDLEYSGSGDAGAARGKPGRILLDPKNIVIVDTPADVFPQYNLIDPNPNPGERFGYSYRVLSTGNITVADILDNFSVGAIYLFDGTTGVLISALVGSSGAEFMAEVTPLSNGNFVVRSPNWNGGRGAAGWGSGTTGLSGTLTANNSLVGSSPGDSVGAGVTILPNGNYVIHSPSWGSRRGAVTWGSATTGIRGVVSAANSFVGSNMGDEIGAFGVIPLTNSNYVVRSLYWNSRRGAATWGSGTTGSSGVVAAENSLVGSSPGEMVGNGIVPLSNGNYVVASAEWNDGRGAATWGSGIAGVVGTISTKNSLVGGNLGDRVGGSRFFNVGGVLRLSNGNYVVLSPDWNGEHGAATWGDGTSGVRGTVSDSNSLVGSSTGDRVGERPTPLSNGNYVIASGNWDRGRGAATWGNGTTGVSGPVSAANSLVGTNSGDRVGVLGAPALASGHYVVLSPTWNGNRGAVTWGNALTGIRGTVSANNSLVGSTPGDGTGSFVAALSNGNYVVTSPGWDGSRGAITWGNGLVGTGGEIAPANSLLGIQPGDRIGMNGVVALSNGNYLVISPNWNGNRGAITWGDGVATTTGVVSVENSMIGSNPGDLGGAGSGILQLTNGNYVVRSPRWNGNRGAVTWGNGTAGMGGLVSAANSLVGSQPNDFVGGMAGARPEGGTVVALSNGNYVVASPLWGGERGAATWGSGVEGIRGVISTDNSLVGISPRDGVGAGVTVLANGNYVIASPYNEDRGGACWVNGTTGRTLNGVNLVTNANSLIGFLFGPGPLGIGDNPVHQTFLAVFNEGSGRVAVAVIADPTDLTFGRFPAQAVPVASSLLTRILSTGTAVTLQASNDITVNAPLTVSAGGKGGSLTLQAGRSILLNANITTDNGPLTLLANDTLASGVVNAQRDPGPAVITMAPGTALNTGTAPLTVELRDADGLTNRDSGTLTLETVVAGSVSVSNGGPSPGGNLVLGAVSTSGPQSYATPNGVSSVTSTLTATNDLVTFADNVELADGVLVDVGDGTLSFVGFGGVLPYGTLTVAGNVLFDAATSFVALLNGPEPGTYSRLEVTGGVELAGSSLLLALGFEPPMGAEFELLATGGVAGIFQGLDEGATFEQDGFTFQITYQGGPGGSSVVVTRVA